MIKTNNKTKNNNAKIGERYFTIKTRAKIDKLIV